MISVIIPALNEAKALPATLQALLGQAGHFEVIVVDGGSTDDTGAIASRYPGVRVLTAARGRAPQMNAGAAVSWLHNRRCAHTGIFYGDQAMFVRRDLFRELGGFPVGDLEDIALSERILDHCEPRFLDAAVVTDSRKFEQMGPLRSLMRCVIILVCYELRLPLAGRAFFSPIR